MKIVITGGAGFIGSNTCVDLISNEHDVVCLDNFLTGKRENIEHLLNLPQFSLVEGDIRDLDTCRKAVKGADLVLHLAALGSVPRSIADPVTTNDININGSLNMIVATRDEGIKRFVYAASSSTYGDSESLPKVEHIIGRPLSPYAITKYVSELYADVFAKTYDMECIGLRYFNVFGRRQDPKGAYAAVIPKFTALLLNHEGPVINGDGTFSRDFTYIDNVIQINKLALFTKNKEALNEVYNVAYGESSTLNELYEEIKSNLSQYDSNLSSIKSVHGPNRKGDIPHSLASIEKAQRLLDYNPLFSLKSGLEATMKWYWDHKSSLEV
ncbi:MAG: SDR family oxidoreductase [Crocinitomicaceae bacterium]|jgi:UDP-N-acetylglucosamine 4-epimerase|tara:strand:- start:369 stop:1346 length:978 start_codon:yes stop_codon:yes gene_type:complete